MGGEPRRCDRLCQQRVVPADHAAHDRRSPDGDARRRERRGGRPGNAGHQPARSDRQGRGVPVDRKPGRQIRPAHSSRTPGYRSSTRRTNWPAACRAASRITHGASVAWPTALPPPRRARRLRMRPSHGRSAWGVRPSRSPRASSCWRPGAWRARASTRANSAEEAVAAAEQLGFPVALKVDLPDILHKTEAGVVRLNLGDAAQVRTAYAEILASANSYAPQARITGVSVQEMVARRRRSHRRRVLRPAIGPGAAVRNRRRDGRNLQRCGPAPLPDHALGSPWR